MPVSSCVRVFVTELIDSLRPFLYFLRSLLRSRRLRLANGNTGAFSRGWHDG